MTARTPEIMIVDGRACNLLATPLEPFLDAVGCRPAFGVRSTANRRGYVGRWEVFGKHLFLTGFVGFAWRVPDHLASLVGPDPDPFEPAPAGVKTMRLPDLFPHAPAAAPATWFTGRLTVATGPSVIHMHAAFASLYRSYRTFNVVSGRVGQVRDWSGGDWAKRYMPWYPDDMVAEAMAEPDEPDEPEDDRLKDWRTMTGGSRRWLCYDAAQVRALKAPSGALSDASASRPSRREQVRRARDWLRHGRVV